jgi:hypothetical protein
VNYQLKSPHHGHTKERQPVSRNEKSSKVYAARDYTMCGIAGWVSYDRDLKSQRDVITTMTKTMARRGPDAGGVWIDRHVGLVSSLETRGR